jgi:multidrug efflux pump subunit AcrA (membrane-fusion protein)
MNTIKRPFQFTFVLAASLVNAGCGGGTPGHDETTAHQASHEDAHDHESEMQGASSNVIDIPPAVRRNLGISFVTVERRRIEQTLRVPGRFEYLPTARREYRTMLPGRVELLVEQFDRVDAGTPLYRIDSPAWREMQQKLAETSSSIERLPTKLATFDPLLAAHDRHEESLQESIDVWSTRVEQLEAVREAGGGRVNELAEARSSLASARAELANVQEKKAELSAARAETAAELGAAEARISFLIDSASSLVDFDRTVLIESVTRNEQERPRWTTIDSIEVRAAEPGVVETLGLTNGAWADREVAVVTVVQPKRLRFHASGLQSDLGVLRDGLEARIVPPAPTTAGRAVHLQDTMDGTLALGLAGEPNDRTIELFVIPEELSAWARPGVAAQLEIITDSTAMPVLAIPKAAVQQDGLTPVIFRRDPDSPNQAIRMEADLGMDDGRWISVLSGLRDGDEIVLDGAFQLMLATSGTMQKGGHFHGDGTFHEEEH